VVMVKVKKSEKDKRYFARNKGGGVIGVVISDRRPS
jgi:hypothetical protein